MVAEVEDLAIIVEAVVVAVVVIKDHAEVVVEVNKVDNFVKDDSMSMKTIIMILGISCS
jgi:hypothetical protein